MIDAHFVTSQSALLRGAESLLVIAPAARYTAKAFPDVLPTDVLHIVLGMADKAKPGDLGHLESTVLVDAGKGKLRRIRVAVLPDTVSRHNSPARTEMVRRAAKCIGDKSAVLAILDDEDHAFGVATGIARAMPLYSQKTKSNAKAGKGKKATKDKAGKAAIALVNASGKFMKPKPIVEHSFHYSREAARLVDVPPSELVPSVFAREAKALLKGIAGVTVTEIVGAKLLEKGLGGIHGVGKCALDAPRLFIARYDPRGAKKAAKHVALVGKGITYDTGGLNLKIQGSMSGMKGDMGGAAATLGAFVTLVRSGCKHKVSLLLCMAENAIGPGAFKPDDILHMHSGKTVEINNTDAEGRLVLGDGVSYAARVLGATHVFDAATLTGAQLVATGRLHAAIVTNDESLEDLVLECGRATGDLCHALPFAPEFYKKEFASKVADMLNSVRDRMNAQSSCAAQFIYNHLDGTDVRWCHVDLAGPAKMDERGTGFGVALLAEAVTRL
ncbi:MAG: leucyl aminopeptidase family protein [Planctomycetes bacterium]|nr:leucyl aminopeptidase family protein [Planctomycetota bacterium]MCB9918278.1 leucyl aminopeptidase family protein [Planctomycetota bacterium]